jgi:hypothetical protein
MYYIQVSQKRKCEVLQGLHVWYTLMLTLCSLKCSLYNISSKSTVKWKYFVDGNTLQILTLFRWLSTCLLPMYSESHLTQKPPKQHVITAAWNELVTTQSSHHMLVGGFQITWNSVYLSISSSLRHDSPLWAIAFLEFPDKIFMGWGCQPHAQPVGTGLHVCDPQRQGDPATPHKQGTHFCCLLQWCNSYTGTTLILQSLHRESIYLNN